MTDARYDLNIPTMENDQAEWRKWMNDRERDEVALSERAKNIVTKQHRVLMHRLKDRCIKRMRRAKPDDKPTG